MWATQALPLQQPFRQEVALQTHAPALHAWPVAQVLHATPPVPHEEGPDVWQTPLLSQQPFGQEVASQTHIPWALHSWFAPQVAQMPPFAPQCCAVEVVHWPFAQQPAQLVPPQLHTPDWQAWPGEHIPHAVPPVPHAVVFWCAGRTQVVPWQHPPAHDVVEQEQAPLAPQA